MIDPTIEDRIIDVFMIEKEYFVSKQEAIRTKGATFCQVRMIILFDHVNPSTIWGTHP